MWMSSLPDAGIIGLLRCQNLANDLSISCLQVLASSAMCIAVFMHICCSHRPYTNLWIALTCWSSSGDAMLFLLGTDKPIELS
jgi:hypothetical protein